PPCAVTTATPGSWVRHTTGMLGISTPLRVSTAARKITVPVEPSTTSDGVIDTRCGPASTTSTRIRALRSRAITSTSVTPRARPVNVRPCPVTSAGFSTRNCTESSCSQLPSSSRNSTTTALDSPTSRRNAVGCTRSSGSPASSNSLTSPTSIVPVSERFPGPCGSEEHPATRTQPTNIQTFQNLTLRRYIDFSKKLQKILPLPAPTKTSTRREFAPTRAILPQIYTRFIRAARRLTFTRYRRWILRNFHAPG